MLFNFPSLTDILYSLPGILLALSFHELAHGLVADMLGDPTARRAGRLTMNPVAHIDIIGFLALLLAGFGWAKPVPVNPFLLKGNRRVGIIAVSAAGPLANLVLAIAGAIVYGAVAATGLGGPIIARMVYELIWFNVILAVFNLIPIPPLDGSQILGALLPGSQEWLVKLQPYGVVILIVLLFTGVFSSIIGPPISLITRGLVNISYLVANIVH
ncbi:MAG: site-2 protease family protein [Peptococcaceae bacterium]|nr:site-2 protease family protein [Peptococcaceae bacterium]